MSLKVKDHTLMTKDPKPNKAKGLAETAPPTTAIAAPVVKISIFFIINPFGYSPTLLCVRYRN